MKLPKIILVLFDCDLDVQWNFGYKLNIQYSRKALNDNFDAIGNLDTDFILFWDGTIELPTEDNLIQIMKSKGNLWHIGPKIGTNDFVKLLDDIKPTDMLHTKVDDMIDHTSWKMSFRGCLMRKDVFEFIPLENYSDSLDIIALDFGYKAIKSGILTRYSRLLAQNHLEKRVSIQNSDEFFFIKKNFDKKALLWTYFMNPGKIRPFRFLNLLKAPKKIFDSTYSYDDFSDISLDEQHTDVSIVIATLERYQVLKAELEELSQLNLMPKEIIIVDQTPIEKRSKKFLEAFSELPIQYIESDKIGQCTARNIGIANAKGTYIWFLDDDMKGIPSNYLESHLKTLHNFEADISCGIPDEIGTNYIERSNRKIEISDGFPTNDVLVKRTLLQKVEGFDIKMNQKQSEDQEIGLRCVKVGALSVKNNQLRIVHLRASRGGLRNHNVRKITFASSRSSLIQRRFLHHSEIYSNLKHFGKRKTTKALMLNIRGTFIIKGNLFRKFSKILIGFILLPHTLFTTKKNYTLAKKMMKEQL